jgi:hypothetical protein
MTATALTETQGIIAIAALAVAALVFVWCAILTSTMRRMHRAQKMVLGDGTERDVIAHGASLQETFEALQEYVGDVASHLDDRLQGAETALAGAISHRSLVRYDAYNELSGQQSMSIALLDDRRSGVVLTCIHHRDQARVYAKLVWEGRGELELSPEEVEAVRVALEGDHMTGSPPAAVTHVTAPSGTADGTGT